MSINERLNPPLWIAQNGITPLPTIYGWANSETGEMLYRVRNIPNPDLSYIFNAKQRKILESTGLLIPTGAIESVDGEYQRFVYDGIRVSRGLVYWHAELPINARLREYQITLKVPQFNEMSTLGLFIADAENQVIMDDPNAFNHVSLDFNGTDLTRVALHTVGDEDNLIRPTLSPQPVTESIVTLTLTNDLLTYTWSGGSNSIAMPSGFFTNPPNVMVYSGWAYGDTSGLVDLSIKVSALDQA